MLPYVAGKAVPKRVCGLAVLGASPPPRSHASSFNFPHGKGSNNPPPHDITKTQTWMKNAAILGDCKL